MTVVRVLIVAREDPRTELLGRRLERDGWRVDVAGDPVVARARASAKPPDLLIVGDLGEDAAGTSAAIRLVRAARGRARAGGWLEARTPIVRVSRGAGEIEILRAFEAGVDEHIALPCDQALVRARLAALLRRSGAPRRARQLRAGAVTLDLDARRAWVHGTPVALRRREFDLLARLAADPDRVCSRAELLHAVWGLPRSVSGRTLDTHASRLRRKLAARGESLVVNVWGVGYRLR